MASVRRTYGLNVGIDDDVINENKGSMNKIISEKDDGKGSGDSLISGSNFNSSSSSSDAVSAAEDLTGSPSSSSSLDVNEEIIIARVKKEIEAKQRTEWVENVMSRAKGAEIRARKQEKAISSSIPLGEKKVIPISRGKEPGKQFYF